MVNQHSLLSNARACSPNEGRHLTALREDSGHGRMETRTVVGVTGGCDQGLGHDFPRLKVFGQIETAREIDGTVTSETRFFASPGCRRRKSS
jgi:hypothetical protein